MVATLLKPKRMAKKQEKVWNEAAARHKAYADKLNSDAQASDDYSMDAFESQKEYKAYRKKKEAKRTKEALDAPNRRQKEDLGYN